MDLEQLEVQRSWPAGGNPEVVTLRTAILNQHEAPVAIDFDRNASRGQAVRTMRQTSVDGRRSRGQPPVSCGHWHTIGGVTVTIAPRPRMTNATSSAR